MMQYFHLIAAVFGYLTGGKQSYLLFALFIMTLRRTSQFVIMIFWGLLWKKINRGKHYITWLMAIIKSALPRMNYENDIFTG